MRFHSKMPHERNGLPHACSTLGLENSGSTLTGWNPPTAKTFPSLSDSSTTSMLSSSSRMGESGVLPCIERNPRWIDATSAEIGVCSTSAVRLLRDRSSGVGVCGSVTLSDEVTEAAGVGVSSSGVGTSQR